MRRIIWRLGLLLALSALAGCGGLAGAASPEAAVLRDAARRPEQMQILGVRHFGDHAVVLYSSQTRDANSGAIHHLLGYSFVARSATGWRAENHGAMGSDRPPDPADILDLGVGTTQTNSGTRTVVYGRALVPEIVAVEALFDDGRAARDEVANGVFAVAMFGATGACALRAFDANGQEVELPGDLATLSGPGCPSD
jgi:hypothetical protein